MKAPTLAVPGLQLLEFIIGHWKTEGTIRATANRPAISIKGADTYEWTLGDSFILHRVDVQMGEEKTEALELIGFDAANDSFPMRSFDRQGSFAFMQGKMESQRIVKIEAEKMRSTLTVNESRDEMTAFWEQSKDGTTWLPWMEMRFTRLK